MTSTEGESGHEPIAKYVTQCTGLALPASRRAFIEAGIARAMAAARVTTNEAYLELLRNSSRALDRLIEELIVGETYFFRDPAHFEFIRRQILPEIRGRRGPDHVVQAWSAGCASGAEPYSLAIVFEEEHVASRVLATDISRVALAKVREGAYGEWSLRNSPPELRAQYFHRQNGRYVLAERIRRAIELDHLNLADDGDQSASLRLNGMDLILCRNVLIYVEPDRIPAVARRLFAALAEGGWLITGPSDPMLSSFAAFRVVVTPAGVFYRREATAACEEPFRFRPESTTACEEPVTGDNGTWAAPEISTIVPSPATLPAPRPISDALPLGREAFAKGDYAKVLELLSELGGDFEANQLRVLSLANLGQAADAERLAGTTAAAAPLLAEGHVLHAVTLLSSRRYEAAAAAARRAIYLRPDLSIAHLILGAVLHRSGSIDGARRALRNSERLASMQPGHEIVPGSGGEPAERFAAAAKAQLALIDELRMVAP